MIMTKVSKSNLVTKDFIFQMREFLCLLLHQILSDSVNLQKN